MSQIHSFADFNTHLRAFISRSAPGGDAEFEGLALALFRLQFEAVPVYRQFCAAKGASPESIRSWSEIPAIPTAAFKEHELSSLPPQERTHVFYSSGTTQQIPSRHFHNAESLAIYEASLLPWFARHFVGSQPLDLLVLAPTTGEAPHSSLAHMFGAVRPLFAEACFAGKIAADGAWILDLEPIWQMLEKSIAKQRPIALLGTAFSFVHLLDACQSAGRKFSLPAGSRVFETGGYKGRSRTLSKQELHKQVSKLLKMPDHFILSEYGMSELSSQAYDCVAGTAGAARIFQFPPWARPQVISPETGDVAGEGEVGLLRIFDLANVRSIMALQTEDLATRRQNGFELLGRAPHSEPRGCSLMPA